MGEISILFFATLKEKMGVPRISLEIEDGSTVGDLKNTLSALYPDAARVLTTALVSVNQEFAFEEDSLPSHAEVGIFPPVSGGGDFPTIVHVTETILDLDELLAEITLPTTGAACLFTGMVRGVTYRGDHHATIRLEYEAYIPMAEAKMRQVAAEIRERWPSIEGIAMVQRIGLLDPKTPTVLIACTAGHRDTGVFEAARYGIDRLKEIVPIWKKEIGPDGEEWVEGDYHPQQSDQAK